VVILSDINQCPNRCLPLRNPTSWTRTNNNIKESPEKQTICNVRSYAVGGLFVDKEVLESGV